MPLNPCRRLLDSEPTAQTTGSELPSVVVTIGEPLPPLSAHQATSIVGGADAPIRNATSFPECPGQPAPVPLVSKATKVPNAILYAAPPLIIPSPASPLLSTPSPPI